MCRAGEEVSSPRWRISSVDDVAAIGIANRILAGYQSEAAVKPPTIAKVAAAIARAAKSNG